MKKPARQPRDDAPAPSEDPRGVARRQFMKMTVATGVGLAIAPGAWAVETRNGMPYRQLGRTGELVSLIGVGGAHIGTQKTARESIEIIRTALDAGVNFLDNSWDYNGGASELRMGEALQDGYRAKSFLMTKIDGRTAASFNAQLEESLRRLQTDHVDLLQFHEVIRLEEPERIFAPGGAMAAMVAAQKAGKTRFIGFTGHKSPQIHLKMLETAAAHDFHFDCVQLPLNAMDAHFNSFGRLVLPALSGANIGVLAMKPLGDKILLKSGALSAVECLQYAMNLPVSVVITGCDSLEILAQALKTARDFAPLSETRVAELLGKTAPHAAEGKFELYKISDHFDSTAAHPEWLG